MAAGVGRTRWRWGRWAVIGTVVAAVALAACGSGGDDGASSGSTPGATTPGCAGDLPQGLDPQPLASPETVRVALSVKVDSFAPLLLADALGELGKENLSVEYVTLKAADQTSVLGNGDVDAAMTAPSAGLFNAMASDLGMKVVGPTHVANPDDRSGLWVRPELIRDGRLDVEALKGTTIASSTGPGSVTSYALLKALEPLGLTATDLRFQQMAAADMVTAIENGAIQAAWLLSPAWQQAVGNPELTFVAGQPEGVSLGSVVFSEAFIEDRCQVGQALIRAMGRTVRDHLQGDYYADPQVLAAMAEATGVPADTLRANPAPVFDPDLTVDPRLMADLQEIYLAQEAVSYPEPLPDDQVLDLRFVEAATS